MKYVLIELLQTGYEDTLETEQVGKPVPVSSLEDALRRTGAEMALVNRGEGAALTPFMLLEKSHYGLTDEEYKKTTRRVWALARPTSRGKK